jgi:heme A synthase
MQKRKRFYVALAIYAVLGVLILVTMEDVPLPVGNGHIGIQSLALIVLALFAVRTVLQWRADQIRGEQDDEDEQDEGASS